MTTLSCTTKRPGPLVVEMNPEETRIYHFVVREKVDSPEKALKYLEAQPETNRSRLLLMLKAELSGDATADKIHRIILERFPTFSPASYALALSEYQHGRIDAAYQFIRIAIRPKCINFNVFDLAIRILSKKTKSTTGLESLEDYYACVQLVNFLQKHADSANLTSLSDYLKQLRMEQIHTLAKSGPFRVSDEAPYNPLNQLIALDSVAKFDDEKSLKVPTTDLHRADEPNLEVFLETCKKVFTEEAASFLYFINRVLVKHINHLDSCSKLLQINEDRLGHLLEYWLAKGLICERSFIIYGNDIDFIQAEKAYLRVLETDPTHPGALHGLAALFYKKYLLTRDLKYFTEANKKLDALKEAHGEEFGNALREKMNQSEPLPRFTNFCQRLSEKLY